MTGQRTSDWVKITKIQTRLQWPLMLFYTFLWSFTSFLLCMNHPEILSRFSRTNWGKSKDPKDPQRSQRSQRGHRSSMVPFTSLYSISLSHKHAKAQLQTLHNATCCRVYRYKFGPFCGCCRNTTKIYPANLESWQQKQHKASNGIHEYPWRVWENIGSRGNRPHQHAPDPGLALMKALGLKS